MATLKYRLEKAHSLSAKNDAELSEKKQTIMEIEQKIQDLLKVHWFLFYVQLITNNNNNTTW